MLEAIDRPILRPARETDFAFVMQSWLRSYWAGTDDLEGVDHDIYSSSFHTFLSRAMQHPEFRVIVAGVPEDPDVITGWAAMNGTGTLLHYVYVKGSLRRHGIASQLMARLAPDFRYTHRTRGGMHLLAKHPGAKYDPWAIL